MLRKTDPNINWKGLETRYIAKYGKAGMTKKKIIEKNPELSRKFEKAVNLVLMEV